MKLSRFAPILICVINAQARNDTPLICPKGINAVDHLVEAHPRHRQTHCLQY